MNAKVDIKSPQIQTSKTGLFKFHGSGWVEKEQFLFNVTGGVDLADALNSVSDLLDMCRDPIFEAAMGNQALEHNPAWLVVHALDSAKAVIDSLKWAAEQKDSE